MLTINNVTYAKCYLCLMLPMRSVPYETEPMQNVTMQKCTLHYVTDINKFTPIVQNDNLLIILMYKN